MLFCGLETAKMYPFMGELWTPSSITHVTRLLNGPTRVCIPNGIFTSSTIFAQFTAVLRQTDRQTTLRARGLYPVANEPSEQCTNETERWSMSLKPLPYTLTMQVLTCSVISLSTACHCCITVFLLSDSCDYALSLDAVSAHRILNGK